MVPHAFVLPIKASRITICVINDRRTIFPLQGFCWKRERGRERNQIQRNETWRESEQLTNDANVWIRIKLNIANVRFRWPRPCLIRNSWNTQNWRLLIRLPVRPYLPIRSRIVSAFSVPHVWANDNMLLYTWAEGGTPDSSIHCITCIKRNYS